MRSRAAPGGLAGTLDDRVGWPVRAGAVPAFAEGFSARPETAAGLAAARDPGAVVMLAPGRHTGMGPAGWLGTCGKTQLAVFLAESLWSSRGVDLLAWVPATSRASILAGYADAAEAVGFGRGGNAEPVATGFLGWLAQTPRSWLLVLDGLADAADLAGLWPEPGPTGRVIVTVTGPPPELPGQVQVLPVAAFSPREALTYLMGRLTADPDQRLGAIDLAEELGCEPLALDHASSVIASSALSCRDYLDLYLRRREVIAEASGCKPAPAAVTWTLSVEHAERLAPRNSAHSLLALAALLDGQQIPTAVFTTRAASNYLASGGGGTAESVQARDGLAALARAGLLTVDTAAKWPLVRMNSAISAAVKAAMPAGMLEEAARSAADALLEAWPADEPPGWLGATLRSCAASLQRVAGDLLWVDRCHPLLPRAGRSLDSARLTGPAVDYWRDLVTVASRTLPPGHPDGLTAGEQLARACLADGRTVDAVSWFQWTLNGWARSLGPDHPSTVAARVELGCALMAAGELGSAVTVLHGAMADSERVHGAGHPATLAARDRLASACRNAGRTSEAIKLYRRTLADRERVQGTDHPETITTRQHLAGIYLSTGRHKDAISQYQRALADSERVLGGDHPDTITARGNLASAYAAAGRIAPGLQLSAQARADALRVWGADHPNTLATSANLALAYYTAGRMTDAVALLRDTAARCERVLPPGDPLTRAVRDSLANIGG